MGKRNVNNIIGYISFKSGVPESIVDKFASDIRKLKTADSDIGCDVTTFQLGSHEPYREVSFYGYDRDFHKDRWLGVLSSITEYAIDVGHVTLHDVHDYNWRYRYDPESRKWLFESGRVDYLTIEQKVTIAEALRL